MTFWAVNYTRGSIAGGGFANLPQENLKTKIPETSLELKLVSTGDGVSFPDGVSETAASTIAVMSFAPGSAPNLDLAIYFTWFNEESDGLAVESYGEFAPVLSDCTSQLAVSSDGGLFVAIVLDENTSELAVSSEAYMYTQPAKANWIKWSHIGSIDFTINRGSVAGEALLDWSGLVYQILQLGTKVIVYGLNGVSIMTPHGISYGMQTIHRRGIKGRNACLGLDSEHFFIDDLGDLYIIKEQLQLLGYREYLSKLTSPVLSYDNSSELLYICDDTYGFVYNPKTQSLGEGPVNITGIQQKNNITYIAAPSNIIVPVLEIWTDIIDFGTRDAKTIESIEVGTDLIRNLLVNIEFRNNKSSVFQRLSWEVCNPAGISYLFCHGVEFRIGLKLTSFDYLEIDYLNIKGRIT